MLCLKRFTVFLGCVILGIQGKLLNIKEQSIDTFDFFDIIGIHKYIKFFWFDPKTKEGVLLELR